MLLGWQALPERICGSQEITYMAMGFRQHSFPVGGLYVKGTGRLLKVEKVPRFSFPLLLKRKMCFTNPLCLHHWERKTSQRSTALEKRIGLQPFLRHAGILHYSRAPPSLSKLTLSFAEVSALHERGSKRKNRITYRTKNVTAGYASGWFCWCCWRLDYWSQSLKIQRLALSSRVALSRINDEDSLTILERPQLVARR